MMITERTEQSVVTSVAEIRAMLGKFVAVFARHGAVG
jgi:hypothetical protein